MAEEQNQVGRRYRGEGAVIRSAKDVTDLMAEQAPYAAKDGAMPIASYFSHKGISNPVMIASMLAFTNIRVATVEDFDHIFETH